MAERSRKRRTTDALEILDHEVGTDPVTRRMIEDERLNARIACSIYRMRTEAGLTQQQLAKLVGTSQSAIARLEDADYDGYSVRILTRIADALNKRLDVEFKDKPLRLATA